MGGGWKHSTIWGSCRREGDNLGGNNTEAEPARKRERASKGKETRERRGRKMWTPRRKWVTFQRIKGRLWKGNKLQSAEMRVLHQGAPRTLTWRTKKEGWKATLRQGMLVGLEEEWSEIGSNGPSAPKSGWERQDICAPWRIFLQTRDLSFKRLLKLGTLQTLAGWCQLQWVRQWRSEFSSYLGLASTYTHIKNDTVESNHLKGRCQVISPLNCTESTGYEKSGAEFKQSGCVSATQPHTPEYLTLGNSLRPLCASVFSSL